jgi:hypothetical protein
MTTAVMLMMKALVADVDLRDLYVRLLLRCYWRRVCSSSIYTRNHHTENCSKQLREVYERRRT